MTTFRSYTRVGAVLFATTVAFALSLWFTPIAAQSPDPSGFVSDDFNACTLNQGAGAWTFSDPLGGATYRTVGAGTGDAWLEIGVPAGVGHDPWNASYNAPRVMRPISNTNFEIEARFLSSMTLGYQVQGILVEQNANNYMRFDFFHDGDGLRIFAARTTNGVSTFVFYESVHPAMARYMRVRRQGDFWTQLYSADGINWATGASFSHVMAPTKAGVFGANSGANPPAHTAMIDWVFSAASPIIAEDAAATGQPVTLSVGVTGSGTVARSPDQSTYVCGSLVGLTATPSAGWQFNGWTGALTGTQNPASIVLGTSQSVQAAFSLIPPPSAPVITNLQASSTINSATITWTTNKPSTGIVQFGLTTAYSSGSATSPTLQTSHSVVLSGLSAATAYHYNVIASGADGLSSSSGDRVFLTLPDPSGFRSDDFNVCAIDQSAGAWIFSDPLGGSTHRTIGTGTGEAWLEISVPAGTSRDPWNTNYNAPRIMRPIANVDFELEVKFLSTMTLRYQVQGILIEQDPANYLRFEFHNDGSGLQLFAARTANGVSAVEFYEPVAIGTPQFMRIGRQGNEWTQRYSSDGVNWGTAARFTQVMAVAKAGVFAATAGTNPPAHVAKFDYIVSTAAPVIPEDGAPAAQSFTLTATASGNGTVTRTPNQPTYPCGTVVSVQATPNPGYTFAGWSGDAQGTQNPITVATTQNKSVTGQFIVNAPPVLTNITVVPGDSWITVSWTTNEPATSRVRYGLTSNFELGVAAQSALVTQHQVQVLGLSPQQTYQLQVISQDFDGADSAPSNRTGTTTAVFPLTVSAVQVVPTETTAAISWTTNKPATSTVRYGLTTAFELGTISNTVHKTTHAVSLPNLTPGTLYQYRITVNDQVGQSVQHSGNFTTPQIAPVIRTWYGDQQKFGNLGIPQVWVNVLGNVSDPDGVHYLHYSLNGGPLKPLTMGPDTRRLALLGDFNVELRYTDLLPGANTVRIVAVDWVGNTSEKVVPITVTHGNTWPTPVNVDFTTVTNVQDVAQVVDGRWTLAQDGLRSVAPWYDRLVAIGDVTWKNYEVTASITTHSFDPAGYAPPSYGAAIGLVVRWQGHGVWDNSQPSWGYWPAGAIASYQWQPGGTERVALIGNQDNKFSFDTSAPPLQFGQPYLFKLRAQTQLNGQHLYQFKMWRANQPEPAAWQHQILNGNLPDDPTHGSVLLFAHHVDASFKTISIVPLPDLQLQPTGEAGANQWVTGGQQVALSGSGAGTGQLTYSWTQISGPTVSLSGGAGSANRTFTAPAAQPGPRVLRFSLVVSNGTYTSEPDVVSVIVPGTNVSSPAEILVVAPHPDDDIITTSGVVQRAAERGEIVRVVFVTNGDGQGVSTGLLRQGEAVNGQAVFGTPENRTIFLGYPDGGLRILNLFHNGTGESYTTPNGVSQTYGNRGLGSADYHRYRFGSAGSYEWQTMVADLRDLINLTRPKHIFTTSEWDKHSDHASTYLLVKEATESVIASVAGYNPTIHATTVWPDALSDSAPWPAAGSPANYFTEPPVNDPATPDWIERESLDVPSDMQSTYLPFNPKYLAVTSHLSQLGSGYIQRFLRKDEFFWTHQLSGVNDPPVPNAGLDQTVPRSTVVTLNASGSFDPDGVLSTYQWRQVRGPAVTLSGATSAHPTFFAPNVSSTTVVEFELVVGDGVLTSVPDGVRVTVQP